MNQNERVIFAELQRSDFEIIVSSLHNHFRRIKWGSQCDDWIWIFHRGYKLEIDSFYSHQLEVKGPRKAYGLVREILTILPPSTLITVFVIPRLDLTSVGMDDFLG